jgi:hypothetical protein
MMEENECCMENEKEKHILGAVTQGIRRKFKKFFSSVSMLSMEQRQRGENMGAKYNEQER